MRKKNLGNEQSYLNNIQHLLIKLKFEIKEFLKLFSTLVRKFLKLKNKNLKIHKYFI